MSQSITLRKTDPENRTEAIGPILQANHYESMEKKMSRAKTRRLPWWKMPLHAKKYACPNVAKPT